MEDAALATVSAAQRGAPGVYQLVDDRPLAVRDWLPAFAGGLGAPEPPRVSIEEALQAAGATAVYYGTQLRGASNAKARRELDFHSRPLEWLAGASIPALGVGAER